VDWININAGGYFERDDITGTSFSPRLAANFHLSPTQTIRAAVARGTRTPDFFEQRVNWTYVAHDATPPLNGSRTVRFYQSAVSPGGLEEERITSREIGYLLRLPQWGGLFDVRVFDDSLTNLISEKLQVSSFEPTNRNSVRLRGAEVQAAINPSERWSLFLTYAYLDNSDASTILERTQYSRHSGALGASYLAADGWRWSLAYYGASGDGVGQNYYGQEDLTVSKTFKIRKTRLDASLILRRLDRRSVTYFRDFGDVLGSRYEARFQLFGSLRVSF
jgi:iron complex outermembrane receptor protein